MRRTSWRSNTPSGSTALTELAPPRRRSYSQLSTWRDCPRLYHHKYVLRPPEQPSVWSIGGTAFHQVAEWILGGHLPPGNYDRIVQAWKLAWDLAEREEREKNPLAAELPLDKWRAAGRGAETAFWWSRLGPEMVERFVDWWRESGLQVFEDEQGPGLERQMTVQLGDVEVIVIPDALIVDEHGQIDILDYKSGKPPKKSLQLGVYAAGLRRALGLEATWGLYYMTRDKQAIPVDLRKWPDQQIVDLFGQFDQQERAGLYDPTPGEACRFCPLRKECDASPYVERQAA